MVPDGFLLAPVIWRKSRERALADKGGKMPCAWVEKTFNILPSTYISDKAVKSRLSPKIVPLFKSLKEVVLDKTDLLIPLGSARRISASRNGQKVGPLQETLAPDDFKIWKNVATKWAFIEVLNPCTKLYRDIWSLKRCEKNFSI